MDPKLWTDLTSNYNPFHSLLYLSVLNYFSTPIYTKYIGVGPFQVLLSRRANPPIPLLILFNCLHRSPLFVGSMVLGPLFFGWALKRSMAAASLFISIIIIEYHIT